MTDISSSKPARPEVRPEVRDEQRPELRAESPQQRAARRAAEIREHRGPIQEGHDEFRVDPRRIPEGWDYEWKTYTVYGQENPGYQVDLAEAGWEAVPADRHPEMMPAGVGHQTIVRKGLMLMERPKELTEEARQREAMKVNQQVKAKEQQLVQGPPGTMERNKASVKRGYEPLQIPADE